MLDALVRIVGSVESVDPEMPAVGFEGLRLNEARVIINDAGGNVLARDDVVDDAKVRIGNGHRDAAVSYACKGLGRRVFVREVRVAIEKHCAGIDSLHRMGVDDLLVERAGTCFKRLSGTFMSG